MAVSIPLFNGDSEAGIFVTAAAKCIFALKAYLGEIINHISAKSDRWIIYVRI